MSDKGPIRTLVKARLAALGEQEKKEMSDFIAHRLLASPEYRGAQTIFFYHSLPSEPDTLPLLSAALNDGKGVYLPRISGEELELVAYRGEDDLKINAYGIGEPVGEKSNVTPDLAVIPLLAFDRDKHRLGRGKGFYDRFLRTFGGKVVALAFSEEEVDFVPTEPHDRSPQVIFTEKERIE